MSVCLAGIYADKMFTHFNFCWNKAILSADRVWKLFPAVFFKFGYKFFLSNVMKDHMYGKPGNILILFACLLFRLGRFGLKVIRFSCFKIADSFCFIKENNFSIYFLWPVGRLYRFRYAAGFFSKPPDLLIEGTKCDVMFLAPDAIRITAEPAFINNGQPLVVCMTKIFVFHADSLPKPKIGSESCTGSYRFEVNRSEYKSCNTEEIPLLGMIIL